MIISIIAPRSAMNTRPPTASRWAWRASISTARTPGAPGPPRVPASSRPAPMNGIICGSRASWPMARAGPGAGLRAMSPSPTRITTITAGSRPPGSARISPRPGASITASCPRPRCCSKAGPPAMIMTAPRPTARASTASPARRSWASPGKARSRPRARPASAISARISTPPGGARASPFPGISGCNGGPGPIPSSASTPRVIFRKPTASATSLLTIPCP